MYFAARAELMQVVYVTGLVRYGDASRDSHFMRCGSDTHDDHCVTGKTSYCDVSRDESRGPCQKQLFPVHKLTERPINAICVP